MQCIKMCWYVLGRLQVWHRGVLVPTPCLYRSILESHQTICSFPASYIAVESVEYTDVCASNLYLIIPYDRTGAHAFFCLGLVHVDWHKVVVFDQLLLEVLHDCGGVLFAELKHFRVENVIVQMSSEGKARLLGW
jgi:hypothetical protein